MYFKTTQAHEEFRAKVRAFAETEVKPIAFLMDKENLVPRRCGEEDGRDGLMGIPYPKEYGGAGLDVISYAIAVEELSRVDGGTGVTSPPTSLWAPGPSSPLARKSRSRNTWCPWPGVRRSALLA